MPLYRTSLHEERWSKKNYEIGSVQGVNLRQTKKKKSDPKIHIWAGTDRLEKNRHREKKGKGLKCG